MRYDVWSKRMKGSRRKGFMLLPIVGQSLFSKRDRNMKHSGLLWWERNWLVSHRMDTPGMKYMLHRRRIMYETAKKKGISYNEYSRRIKRWYDQQGWKFKNGRLNPFKMFEWFRDKKNLDVTPQPKKRVVSKDYIEYKERTLKEKKR